MLLWLLPGVAAFACILSAIRLGRRQGINCQTEARLVVFVVSVSVSCCCWKHNGIFAYDKTRLFFCDISYVSYIFSATFAVRL